MSIVEMFNKSMIWKIVIKVKKQITNILLEMNWRNSVLESRDEADSGRFVVHWIEILQ